jgi:hypothetical protein
VDPSRSLTTDQSVTVSGQSVPASHTHTYISYVLEKTDGPTLNREKVQSDIEHFVALEKSADRNEKLHSWTIQYGKPGGFTYSISSLRPHSNSHADRPTFSYGTIGGHQICCIQGQRTFPVNLGACRPCLGLTEGGLGITCGHAEDPHTV